MSERKTADACARFAASAAVLFVLAVGVALAADAPPDGSALYAKRCASCHGADGRGDTPAGRALHVQSLLLERWSTSEGTAAIEKAIRDGVPPAMKSLAKELSSAEISAIATAVTGMAQKTGTSPGKP